MTEREEQIAETQRIRKNLFKNLDDIWLFGDVTEIQQLMGRAKTKGKKYFVFKMTEKAKMAIWRIVENRVNYGKALAHKRGFEKGLVMGALKAKGGQK